MPSAETARLVAELTLKDKMSAGLKSADKSLRSFDKATSNTQKSLGKFGRNIEKGIAIGVGAVVTGGILVTKAASDYEDAFAGIRKTVTETANTSFAELSDGIRDLSKTIPIAATELAALGEAGGALGVPTDDLLEFVRVTALLGETTDLTAEAAADSLGVIGNVLHLTAADYSAFASSLVALGNAGASTESQIIAIAQNAGAAGELIGLTTDQVLGLSSAVASLGIDPEAGGSALQKFFIDTAKFVNAGGDELKLFAKITGKSAKEFKKSFEKDAGGALEDFLAGLGKLSQGEQLTALEDLGFNDVRITRTLLGLANNTELVGSQLDIANKAFKENTALSKEAAERNKAFASQMQITKNVLNDIAITIGSKLLPKLTPLLQQFNKFVSENQGQIEKFGDDVAKAFEDIATNVAKVDWQPFIDGLKFTADVGRAAIGIFQSMPDWLQKLIVAGFAVNKLTGGLVTSLGKDLFGTVGAQFFSRGSSAANPLWVQSVGGIGGAGGVGGKGVSGALGLVQKVFMVGIAAEAANLIAPVTTGAGIAIHDQLGLPKITLNDLQWPFGPKNTPTILPEIFGGNGALGGTGGTPKNQGQLTGPGTSKQQGLSPDGRQEKANQEKLLTAVHNATSQDKAISVTNQQAAFAIRDAVNTKVGVLGAITERVRAAADATKAAAHAAGQQTAAAIRDKDLSVANYNSVTVNNRVSVQETIKTQTTFKQFNKFIS